MKGMGIEKKEGKGIVEEEEHRKKRLTSLPSPVGILTFFYSEEKGIGEKDGNRDWREERNWDWSEEMERD
jgi:hypothetical protein